MGPNRAQLIQQAQPPNAQCTRELNARKWTILRDRASRPGCPVRLSMPSPTACVLSPPTRSDALSPSSQARGAATSLARGPAAHPRQLGSRFAGEAFPGSEPARKRRAWLRNFSAAVPPRLQGGACDPKTGTTRIPPGTLLQDLWQHGHPGSRTSC